MGDRLTEDGKQTESRTYGDIFDELFPHYLLMGMSPEEYWDGEGSLKRAYRKAYQMRLETEQRIADRNNWYMGQYMMAALHCTPLLVAGLNVKRTTQLPEYPKIPFLQQAEEEKNKAVKKKHEEDQMTLAMAMFQASIEQFNRNVRKRQAEKAAAEHTGQ